MYFPIGWHCTPEWLWMEESWRDCQLLMPETVTLSGKKEAIYKVQSVRGFELKYEVQRFMAILVFDRFSIHSWIPIFLLFPAISLLLHRSTNPQSFRMAAFPALTFLRSFFRNCILQLTVMFINILPQCRKLVFRMRLKQVPPLYECFRVLPYFKSYRLDCSDEIWNKSPMRAFNKHYLATNHKYSLFNIFDH